MDNNNGSPPQGGEPAMDAGDWRCQLQVDSRQRIVNKIMDTLKRHLPFSGQEGLHELKKIAVRFEEKIYVAATSQSDYLRKISLKMLTMETKSQNTMANSLQSNSVGSSGMQPQVTSQGQLLSENIQSNIPPAGVQNSAGLPSALPPTSGPQQQILPPQHQPQQLIGVMDNNNGSPPQGGEPAIDAGDWRSQLQADSRQRIVIKIMDTLRRHIPYSSEDELKKIAVRFEEKIYVAATSQSDYLRKISLKMLTMETKSQNTMANSLQSNSVGSSGMQPQVTSQGQLLSENIQSNIPPAGVQNSAGLSSALPPTSGPQQQILPLQHQPQQLIASLDSTAQTGNTNGADWKEEVYQKYQKEMQKLHIFQQHVQRQKELQKQLPGQLQPELHQISVFNDVNTNAFSSSQSGINMLQANVIPPSILQKQQQVYRNQLQMQLLHQQQMQLQLVEKQKRIQQQQQQQVPGLSQAHQLPQLHQISVVKDVNVDAWSSQAGSSMLQANIDPPQPNSITVDNKHLKQDQEQKMFQNQLKQPYQQQWMQKQQMLQEMQQLQIQKLQQQAKQQLHHIYVIYLIFLTILLGAAFFGTGY